MQKPALNPIIADASAEEIFTVIKSENQQMQALVLSLLGSDQASQVLRLFAPTMAAELIQKIANLEDGSKQISEQAFQDLEDFLIENLQKIQILHGSRKKLGGSDHVAKILSQMPGDSAKPVLDQLKESQPQLWERIDQAMFNMAILKRIEAKDLIGFLTGVPDKILILAMKNIAPEIKEKIFAALSERRRAQIEDELQVKQRSHDVNKAQQEFLHLLRAALEKGSIKLIDPQDRWV